MVTEKKLQNTKTFEYSKSFSSKEPRPIYSNLIKIFYLTTRQFEVRTRSNFFTKQSFHQLFS